MRRLIARCLRPYRSSSALATLSLLLCYGAVAQSLGDVAVLGRTIGFPAVARGFVVDRGGTVVAQIPSLALWTQLEGAAAAPDNDGIVFVLPRATTTYFLYKYNGVNTILSTLRFYPRRTRVDQNGDILLADTAGGIYRFGGGVLTTITGGFVRWLSGFSEDIDTGNFVVTDLTGTVTILSRTGTRLTTRPNAFPPSNVPMTLHKNYATGGVLAAAGSLLNYNVSTNMLTTVFPVAGPGYSTLDYDPISQGYFATTLTSLDRFSRAFAQAQVAALAPLSPYSIVTWGSRMLTGRASPTPGSSYPILLSMPGEGGQFYQVAASFGTRPGIGTPAGRIYLNPDALFAATIAPSTVFRRFAGRLPASAATQVSIDLPNAPALSGTRFHVAAVTYNNNGIRLISEPLGVTIE